jgi:hypothetical protein
MRPLTTAILSGFIANRPWDNDYLAAGRVRSLFERWEAARLVERREPDGLALTANGGWFAGNMIRDLTGIDPPTARRG